MTTQKLVEVYCQDDSCV